MLTQIPSGRREGDRYLSPGVSVATHILIIGVLLFAGRAAWKVRPASARGGHQSSLLYWTDGMGRGAIKAHVTGKLSISPPKKKKEVTTLQAKKQPAVSPVNTPDGQVQASQAGSSNTKAKSDVTGAGSNTQDMNPAFPIYSPNPPVKDRSLLPNEETNVVVDVNVSAQGDVLDEKLIRGLGNNIDQLVLETVRSWKFHPATLDGNPVASVSELVFPMGQRYRG